MLKYATAQVMSKIMIPQDADRRELRRIAHKHDFKYDVRKGFLYVRSRAISSRCNDNFDAFPAEEIESSYKTFIGKPVFVNHVNHDHKRARGVIIDAALHKDSNRDGSKDWWVEVLQEIDAIRFPRLAAEVMKGNIARTSMGCDVAYSVCSACGNKATTPAEYCVHIPAAKGQRLYRTTASGKKVGELIRETCFGLKFFENSLLVEPPADPTAFVTGVDLRGLDKAASRTANTGGLSWDEIGAKYPHVYGDPEFHGAEAEGSDGEGIGDAASHLAFDREEDPDGEGSSVHDLTFHHQHVDPYQIDHARHGTDDGRVRYAAEGYRENPGQVPPLVLVHRHGIYQVADGHHRAEGAKLARQKTVPAYVAYSPHARSPFSDGSRAPFHGAEKSSGQKPRPPRPKKETPTSGPGWEQERLFEAARKLAYGETKAPQDVDTLRDDACAVCGDRDTYDGNTCQVCGYIAPPKMFQDPDLELARSMDLRKDVAEFNGQPGEPVDPNSLDENGNPMPGGGGDPNAQPGSLPGEVQAEVQPGGDPVDPKQLDADGGIPDELGAPVDPAMLGPDGQPLPQAGQQQMTAPDGTPLDPQGQQPMLGPDGMPVGPQELPASAISGDGKPFHHGPNMPERPGEPDGPQGPEDLDEDGQPLNPDAGQGAPGTPEDGVPDLVCPECGFTADATQPTTIDMDTANTPSTGEATPDGVQAGDICPNCGQGLLLTATEMQGQAPVPSPI